MSRNVHSIASIDMGYLEGHAATRTGTEAHHHHGKQAAAEERCPVCDRRQWSCSCPIEGATIDADEAAALLADDAPVKVPHRCADCGSLAPHHSVTCATMRRLDDALYDAIRATRGDR